MNPVLESHRQEVAEACQRFDVERLEAFGSATRANFDPASSDVDFIVRFRSPEAPGYADRFLGLAESLEQILGRRVDLVTERSLRNPVLLRNIAPDRATVYAA
ncbi:MAG TPA: nucleotidyltransferase domain-containing protein [Opitutaceae bacterium]|nr:nucleotidyltransferase domain-containing protein [Opitutaceae bacterium]